MPDLPCIVAVIVVVPALIGRLHAVGSGAHVHFGLLKNGTAICPEPYFTADTRQSVLALVQRTYPGSNMCY